MNNVEYLIIKKQGMADAYRDVENKVRIPRYPKSQAYMDGYTFGYKTAQEEMKYSYRESE